MHLLLLVELQSLWSAPWQLCSPLKSNIIRFRCKNNSNASVMCHNTASYNGALRFVRYHQTSSCYSCLCSHYNSLMRAWGESKRCYLFRWAFLTFWSLSDDKDVQYAYGSPVCFVKLWFQWQSSAYNTARGSIYRWDVWWNLSRWERSDHALNGHVILHSSALIHISIFNTISLRKVWDTV